ncbi:SDR family NAD(P)-dependent oxidoreductase [Mucilaginibacter endophyticus]|uniref:SDR family NAD(P)-dependent oxidoreductase n=1 Tax=Mucilaginibacter endophyticus TaxID=2675003 RepID=UPI000E0D5BD6|nr:glucose 1-dehydrogenase [Mucilaginibacter endophyticus]
MKKLADKVAVVTGSSKGIGAGIAKGLAAEGASVVINYSSSQESADKTVAEIIENGGKAIAIKGSVVCESDIARLFEETVKTFGTVDILVNNAGVYRFAPLEGITAEDFHFMFDINVRGVFLTTKEAVKHFNGSGGSIINIGSVVTSLAPAGSSVYNASKCTADIITKSLSKELAGRKIRVNSVNPGMVDTEGNREKGIIGTPFEDMMLNMTLLGRAGQPGDIADVVVFLASEDSRFMTGEVLRVTGGMA